MSYSPSSSRQNPAFNNAQLEPISNARVPYQDSAFLAQDLQKKEELLLDFRRQCRENGAALEASVRTNEQLRDQLDRARAELQGRTENIASTAQQSIAREIRSREDAEREGALWKQRYEDLFSTNKEVEKENLLWQERYTEIRAMADRLKQEQGQLSNLERDLQDSRAREQASHDETKRILDSLKHSEDERLYVLIQ